MLLGAAVSMVVSRNNSRPLWTIRWRNVKLRHRNLFLCCATLTQKKLNKIISSSLLIHSVFFILFSHLPKTMTPELPPEVLSVVAKHFTPKQATVPSLVCHNWHQVFAPVIWRKLGIHSSHSLQRPQSLEQLTRNAHLIRELTYQNRGLPSECLSIPFTRLTKLCLFCESSMSANMDVDFARLVAMNHQLEELSVVGLRSGEGPNIWWSIASMPKLRDLSIYYSPLTMEELATLLQGLNGTEKLELLGNHCSKNLDESF